MSTSLQKSLSRLSTGTNSVDKKVNNFIKNDTNLNLLRVVLVAYAVLIDKVPNQVITLFEHFGVRLVISSLVAYLLFKDVVTALLLALCFILSVQELKKRMNGPVKVNGNNQNMNDFDEVGPSPNPSMISGNQKVFLNNTSQYPEDKPYFEDPEERPDPAFRTMTQNLVEGSAFTTDEQLKNVGTNLVQGVDPDDGVKTFVNQHGAQGLDVPLGFDPDSCQTSKF
jgi:hypothetical protein